MKLESIRNKIYAYLVKKTPRIAHVLYRIYKSSMYKRVFRLYADTRDKQAIKRYIKQTGLAHVPPVELRDRVHGSTGTLSFLKVGKKCSEDLESTLSNINRDLGSFREILDFGCGCGRTLIWFADRFLASNFYGTDIDAEAISWCRGNLDFASFNVNRALPPMDYHSEMFDFIYAISVFTHINEDLQFRWLRELKRIAKPEGILLLTVHGEYCWKDLPRDPLAKLKKDGFVFVPVYTWKGIFPDWYQLAFHTKDYVLERWSQYFDILDYIPRGLNNHQDMILLKKT